MFKREISAFWLCHLLIPSVIKRILPAQVNLTPVPDENAVIVSADTYVHAVELEGEAVFSDNCFSLLPGESRKVAVRGAKPETITVQAYTNLF